MSTLTQIIKKKRKKRKYKNKRPDLQKCPQKKATCLKVFNMTPRKPNSALRKVA
jgi:small subunit ribosomal protein S12